MIDRRLAFPSFRRVTRWLQCIAPSLRFVPSSLRCVTPTSQCITQSFRYIPTCGVALLALSCSEPESTPSQPPARIAQWALAPPIDVRTVTARPDSNRVFPTEEVTRFLPVLEWSIPGVEFSEDPFDVEARVEFLHRESGAVRNTGMFFAAPDSGDVEPDAGIWKFRFCGDLPGTWSFQSSSIHPSLDGFQGEVRVILASDPAVHGFLGHDGSKFTRQSYDGELEAILFNVWEGGFSPDPATSYARADLEQTLPEDLEQFPIRHGMTALYAGDIFNRWFRLETVRSDEHDSRDPDLRTFEALERVIQIVHRKGLTLHIWAWGDEQRKQTQIGAGGINGEPDRRVQRYIAARLGPLPGWSMGYGYDLDEWVSTSQLAVWADYMHAQMGWPHLLFARGYALPELDGASWGSNRPDANSLPLQTSPNGPASYEEVLEQIASFPDRPHLDEERFFHLREFGGGPPWTGDRTLQVLWWNAMAGGVGAWWGAKETPPYTNAEQLRCFARFWANRFTLGMTPQNPIDVPGEEEPSADSRTLWMADRIAWKFVFYVEEEDEVQIDLTSSPCSLPVVAVDANLPYEEIRLGYMGPELHRWQAPYVSRWAIAVGNFPMR